MVLLVDWQYLLVYVNQENIKCFYFHFGFDIYNCLALIHTVRLVWIGLTQAISLVRSGEMSYTERWYVGGGMMHLGNPPCWPFKPKIGNIRRTSYMRTRPTPSYYTTTYEQSNHYSKCGDVCVYMSTHTHQHINCARVLPRSHLHTVRCIPTKGGSLVYIVVVWQHPVSILRMW